MTLAQPSQVSLDASVRILLPQLRAATLRLLTAVLQLDDAELALPARSALGTRRHVIARVARRADRTTRSLDGHDDAVEPADRLLDMGASDLMAALAASLGGVLGALAEHVGGTRTHDEAARIAAAHAHEHLAWVELSHVDLDAGYDMHDVPDASLDAIAEHFRTARSSEAASSPFAPLMAS